MGFGTVAQGFETIIVHNALPTEYRRHIQLATGGLPFQIVLQNFLVTLTADENSACRRKISYSLTIAHRMPLRVCLRAGITIKALKINACHLAGRSVLVDAVGRLLIAHHGITAIAHRSDTTIIAGTYFPLRKRYLTEVHGLLSRGHKRSSHQQT